MDTRNIKPILTVKDCVAGSVTAGGGCLPFGDWIL